MGTGTAAVVVGFGTAAAAGDGIDLRDRAELIALEQVDLDRGSGDPAGAAGAGGAAGAAGAGGAVSPFDPVEVALAGSTRSATSNASYASGASADLDIL